MSLTGFAEMWLFVTFFLCFFVFNKGRLKVLLFSLLFFFIVTVLYNSIPNFGDYFSSGLVIAGVIAGFVVILHKAFGWFGELFDRLSEAIEKRKAEAYQRRVEEYREELQVLKDAFNTPEGKEIISSILDDKKPREERVEKLLGVMALMKKKGYEEGYND